MLDLLADALGTGILLTLCAVVGAVVSEAVFGGGAR